MTACLGAAVLGAILLLAIAITSAVALLGWALWKYVTVGMGPR